MKILPSVETVREIAKSGQYDILPVSCEILSDICTPIEAMKILKNVSTHCYMLESVAELEKWGRYTFLGFDPKLEITCVNGSMKVGDLFFETDNPTKQIREILDDDMFMKALREYKDDVYKNEQEHAVKMYDAACKRSIAGLMICGMKYEYRLQWGRKIKKLLRKLKK